MNYIIVGMNMDGTIGMHRYVKGVMGMYIYKYHYRKSFEWHDRNAYIHDEIMVRMRMHTMERWGARVETQKNVRGEIEGWGRVPFNEPYAPSLITIYDGA